MPNRETPLADYQVILFNKNSYIRLAELVGHEQQDEYLPEFRAMAHSLRIQK